MVWTPPFSTGIEMPKWRCNPTTSERERHHEDYDDLTGQSLGVATMLEFCLLGISPPFFSNGVSPLSGVKRYDSGTGAVGDLPVVARAV